MRAFQAIVAAAARAGTLEASRGALQWLERQQPPRIVAPDVVASTAGYRLSVPHNAMDIVAKQWTRGDEGNAAEHRTMKNVRPHRLPDDAVVHYVWPLGGEASLANPLIEATRGVVALGWGIDLVVGDGGVVDGERVAELSTNAKVWEARADGRKEVRAPTDGTLADLERRHAAFLTRTSFDDPTLRPPAALSAFSIVRYGRADQPVVPEIAGFTLMHPESDRFRAFDAARHGKVVSGMLRHVVKRAAERAGWEAARVNATVLGHGDGEDARLLLVPVPSIEPRGGGAETVGAIRRVMLFSTDPRSGDITWAARALGGMDLIDESTGEVQAVLAATNRDDRVQARYLSESTTWATVTPMVLPGLDDPGGLRAKLRNARGGEEQRSAIERLAKRREALIRKALRHAGLGDELAFSATIEAREVGFFAGVEKAARYAVPAHLAKSPRMHVKLTWPFAVSGPMCIGRGRFSGLGLFATVRS